LFSTSQYFEFLNHWYGKNLIKTEKFPVMITMVSLSMVEKAGTCSRTWKVT